MPYYLLTFSLLVDKSCVSVNCFEEKVCAKGVLHLSLSLIVNYTPQLAIDVCGNVIKIEK